MPGRTRIDSLRRRNLDRRALDLEKAGPRPSKGWVAELRSSLGIPAAVVGKRMGISARAVTKLEAAEKEGGITIRKLEELAAAFDSRLVYGFVPMHGTFDEMLKARAQKLAIAIVEKTEESMRLEAQGVDTRELQARVAELSEELLHDPKRLWASSEV